MSTRKYLLPVLSLSLIAYLLVPNRNTDTSNITIEDNFPSQIEKLSPNLFVSPIDVLEAEVVTKSNQEGDLEVINEQIRQIEKEIDQGGLIELANQGVLSRKDQLYLSELLKKRHSLFAERIKFLYGKAKELL